MDDTPGGRTSAAGAGHRRARVRAELTVIGLIWAVCLLLTCGAGAARADSGSVLLAGRVVADQPVRNARIMLSGRGVRLLGGPVFSNRYGGFTIRARRLPSRFRVTAIGGRIGNQRFSHSLSTDLLQFDPRRQVVLVTMAGDLAAGYRDRYHDSIADSRRRVASALGMAPTANLALLSLSPTSWLRTDTLLAAAGGPSASSARYSSYRSGLLAAIHERRRIHPSLPRAHRAASEFNLIASLASGATQGIGRGAAEWLAGALLSAFGYESSEAAQLQQISSRLDSIASQVVAVQQTTNEVRNEVLQGQLGSDLSDIGDYASAIESLLERYDVYVADLAAATPADPQPEREAADLAASLMPEIRRASEAGSYPLTTYLKNLFTQESQEVKSTIELLYELPASNANDPFYSYDDQQQATGTVEFVNDLYVVQWALTQTADLYELACTESHGLCGAGSYTPTAPPLVEAENKLAEDGHSHLVNAELVQAPPCMMQKGTVVDTRTGQLWWIGVSDQSSAQARPWAGLAPADQTAALFEGDSCPQPTAWQWSDRGQVEQMANGLEGAHLASWLTQELGYEGVPAGQSLPDAGWKSLVFNEPYILGIEGYSSLAEGESIFNERLGEEVFREGVGVPERYESLSSGELGIAGCTASLNSCLNEDVSYTPLGYEWPGGFEAEAGFGESLSGFGLWTRPRASALESYFEPAG